LEKINKKKIDIIERMKKDREKLKESKQENLFINLKDGFLHIIFIVMLLLVYEG
jgi:hypothetical protein